jgi:hypothetical protein
MYQISTSGHNPISNPIDKSAIEWTPVNQFFADELSWIINIFVAYELEAKAVSAANPVSCRIACHTIV